MTNHDETYLKGMKEILDTGAVKTDRTGTGTISVIGMMLKYNLRDGTIPLLTTKKINTQALLNELVWFISGSGSGKRLLEKGVKIWNEWMTPDQHLNYVYGYQWRFWPCAKVTKSMLVKDKSNFKLDNAIYITYNDFNDYTNPNLDYDKEYYHLWQSVLNDCVGQKWMIDPDWLVYDNFAHDIIYVPGFLKEQTYQDEYCLTPLWSNSNIAHRDTVGFMHFDIIHNIQNGTKWVKYDNHEWLCEADHGQGFMPDVEGYVRRPKLHHDQLQDAIDLIKKDPYSRRIIVNSWNVDMLDQMQLPPCHFNFQFINQPVGDKIETSLKLDMRSNDYCLGNPFNIAQYAIMLRMVCHLCGTVPGDLIYVGTDVHIYSNHIEQAKMQLERLGMQSSSPTLRFVDRTIKTIDDFTVDDIIIENYTPMPFIKFPIAV